MPHELGLVLATTASHLKKIGAQGEAVHQTKTEKKKRNQPHAEAKPKLLEHDHGDEQGARDGNWRDPATRPPVPTEL